MYSFRLCVVSLACLELILCFKLPVMSLELHRGDLKGKNEKRQIFFCLAHTKITAHCKFMCTRGAEQ